MLHAENARESVFVCRGRGGTANLSEVELSLFFRADSFDLKEGSVGAAVSLGPFVSEDTALAVKSVQQILVIRKLDPGVPSQRRIGESSARAERERSNEGNRRKPIRQGNLSSISFSFPHRSHPNRNNL